MTLAVLSYPYITSYFGNQKCAADNIIRGRRKALCAIASGGEFNQEKAKAKKVNEDNSEAGL